MRIRDMRRILCVMIVGLCFNADDLYALSVGYWGSSSPFTIKYQPTLQTSIEPILQVVNNTVDAYVTSWQLKLEIRPLGGSHGALLFHDVSVPPNSLFGQDPRPITLLEGPSNTALTFDFTSNTDGELVLNGSARNILQATIVASSDAAGAFQLVMLEFNPEPSEQDNSSSWFPANAPDPIAFDNLAVDGVVLLGTINVDQSYALGDYDHNGAVGPSDYVRWREHFGSSVNAPGDDADGNQNSAVDVADYVVWRAHQLPSQLSSNSDQSGRRVPETNALALTIVGLYCIIFSGRMRPHRGCFLSGLRVLVFQNIFNYSLKADRFEGHN